MSHLLSVAAALAALAAPVDYQQRANSTSWEWHPDRAGLMYAMMSAPKEYTITVVRPKDSFGQLTIRIQLDEKTGYSWDGNEGTPFLIVDKVLYYADYNPSSSGCAVVAYDLEKQKPLWKTDLQGLGPIAHFRYHNAVEMDIDGDALRVFGNESAGRYVEYVDLKDGKTVGHKVFKDG